MSHELIAKYADDLAHILSQKEIVPNEVNCLKSLEFTIAKDTLQIALLNKQIDNPLPKFCVVVDGELHYFEDHTEANNFSMDIQARLYNINPFISPRILSVDKVNR